MATLQAEGSKAEIGIIEEKDGWNSGLGSGTNWTGLRFNREALGQDINVFESEEIRDDRMIAAILQGNRRAEGDITFELGPNSHNLLILHTLANTFTGGAGVKTITGSKDLPSGGLVIVKGFTDIPKYIEYRGGRIDSFALEFPQEGIVTGTARFMTGQEVTPSASAPYSSLTYPATDPYESNDTEIYLIAEQSGAGDPFSYSWGSPIAIGTAGRFAITNTLDGNSFVLNSTMRYSIPIGRRRIEGSLNLLFLDTDHYLDYVNGTAKAIRIKMKRGTDYHDWIFPAAVYAGPRPTPAIEGEGGIRYDLPFRATRHESLLYDVIVKINSTEDISRY